MSRGPTHIWILAALIWAFVAGFSFCGFMAGGPYRPFFLMGWLVAVTCAMLSVFEGRLLKERAP